MLKHLPVANLNQVKDTKVLKVVSKWARKPSVACVPEEETSSSDVDSRELSPQDGLDDSARREVHISSSSDELQNSSKTSEALKSSVVDVLKSDVESKSINQGEITAKSPKFDDNVFEPGEIPSDEDQKSEGDNPERLNVECLNPEGPKSEALKSEGLSSEGEKSDGPKPEERKLGEVKHEGLKPHRVKSLYKNSIYSRVVERIGDSSEEESSRWSEDDATSSDCESIIDLAADLLDQWSTLKVLYMSFGKLQSELIPSNQPFPLFEPFLPR